MIFPRWWNHVTDMPDGHYRLGRRPDGTVTATIRCPVCHQTFTLDHIVAADGTISPSVVCPHEGCSFHPSAARLERVNDVR